MGRFGAGERAVGRVFRETPGRAASSAGTATDDSFGMSRGMSCEKEVGMTRAASVLLLVVILSSVGSAGAQQAPKAVTPTRQAFRSIELGMTREQVAKLVVSQGPLDLKQEIWGRWVPGVKPGEMEVLRVHFFDNRVYWVEYDAFGEAWWREEKGGCSDWIRIPLRRLKDSLQVK
jgi:hypothetical protein